MKRVEDESLQSLQRTYVSSSSVRSSSSSSDSSTSSKLVIDEFNEPSKSIEDIDPDQSDKKINKKSVDSTVPSTSAQTENISKPKSTRRSSISDSKRWDDISLISIHQSH